MFSSPTSAAMTSANQINPMAKQYYQPYIDAGTGAMTDLQGRYTNLLNDPGGVFNKMGQSFQQSPGFNFAMQQALQGSNHAAAAGGMAGSPEHEQQNQQLATNLADQDYYNYMNHVEPLYNEGLHGEQGMMSQGYNATKSLTDMIAQELSAQAALQYKQDASKNSTWDSLMKGVGEGASMFMLK